MVPLVKTGTGRCALSTTVRCNWGSKCTKMETISFTLYSVLIFFFFFFACCIQMLTTLWSMLETIQMLCVQSSSLRWFRVVGFFFFGWTPFLQAARISRLFSWWLLRPKTPNSCLLPFTQLKYYKKKREFVSRGSCWSPEFTGAIALTHPQGIHRAQQLCMASAANTSFTSPWGSTLVAPRLENQRSTAD